MTNAVQFEAVGDVALLRFDDNRANAINPVVTTGLSRALDRAAGSSSLVIAGRPGFFCAGFDLSILRGDPAQARDAIVAAWRLYHRLYMYERPVVLAVTGHAIGFGGLLLATGDDRMASDGPWSIGLNEISLGIAMDPAFLAPTAERINARHRTATLLFGETLSPAAALETGFVDELVSDDVTAAALVKAKRLGALPSAYGQQKRSLRRTTAERLWTTIDALARRPVDAPLMTD